MKRILWIAGWVLAGLVVLLVAAGAYLLTLLSPDNVRAEVEKAVEAATGRDLTIKGEVGVSLWPVFGVSAKDVALANAPGGQAPALLNAREIKVGVAIWPLLNRRIEVHELLIESPKLALEVDAKGSANWIFAPTQPSAPAPSPAPGAPAPTLTVHTVRISDGELSFADVRTGQRYGLEKLNAESALAGWNTPSKLRASGVFNGEPVKLDSEIARPGLLLDAGDSGLTFSLQSAPLNARFSGSATASSGVLKGALEAAGPDLRRLASWVGAPIGEGATLKAFDVKGALTRTGERFAFENATVAIDEARGRGDFVLESVQAGKARRPLLSGRLEVFGLNLNPYLTFAKPTAQAANVEIAALDVKRAGWDETPLDFSSLAAIDASLELTVSGPLIVQTMQLDRVKADLALQNGLLSVSMDEMQMYGGSGDGRLVIDARQTPVRIANEVTINGVRAERFLKAFMGYDQLNAGATVRFSLTAAGQSQRALIASLTGEGGFVFSDGALSGVDFGGVSRTIGNLLDGKLFGPQAKTPFDGFSATFKIANGVAATRDFTLENRETRLTAIGAIDIGAQSMELRLSPASVVGRRRDGSASTGLALPFVVRGPWNKLAFEADIIGAARSNVERRVCGVLGQIPGARAKGC